MGEIWGRQTIKTERERERRDRGQQLEKPLKCVARTIKNDEFIRIFCFFLSFYFAKFELTIELKWFTVCVNLK